MCIRLTRKVVRALSLLALVLASGESLAQTGGTIGTTSVTGATALSSSDFAFFLEYQDPNNWGNWIQMNTTQQQYFFNRARCECVNSNLTNPDAGVDNTGNTDYSGYFRIVIQPGSGTAQRIQTLLSTNGVPFGIGKLYAGNNGANCLSPGSYSCALAANCTNLLDPNNFDAQFPLTVFESERQYVSPPIPVSLLYGSLAVPTCGCSGTCDTTANCALPLTSQTIYFWAQTNTGTSPDLSLSFQVNLNGELQYGPSDVVAQGGNDALNVTWGWASGLTPSADPNFLGVQIFCTRADTFQVFPLHSYSASYMQSSATCSELAPAPASPSAFNNLDPSFLCSGLLPSTTTSQRITGLQNGIWYGVGVAAIDKYGNVSAIPESSVTYGMPVATVDFYTEYRNSGGQAKGGYCSLAGWQKRPAALIVISFVALAVIVFVRRRRKGPPGTTTMLLLVAAGTVVGGRAHAGGIIYDDMDTSSDDNQTAYPEPEPEPTPPPPPSTWASERDFAIEVRFGLYLPDVDSEFGGKAQPNAFLFGTQKRPMWQFELDWEVLQKFGTLSIGASIGYWKENGQACLLSDLQANGTCTPSADNTSLRLIPFAALLIYRMDEAANRWKIPLVPYGKIGLNYTIWTINNGDGDVPTYKGTGGGHGQGGTAGWQAAAGISLRLDFVDPSAAREFDVDSGVNHTYAFFELDHVDGSGLYRTDVLHVGDNTWFAGLMFEF